MKIVGQEQITVDETFAQEILERSGENVFICYQCRKCAAGCPNRMFMEKTPTELMRYLQLGMVDKAMEMNTIWYCLSCHTCSVRCPQGIDIAHIVDTIRIMGHEKGLKIKVNHAGLFSRLWMRMLKYIGRLYEPGLTGLLNVFSGKPFKDLPLGFKMMRKGKLKLWPSITKPFSMIRMFRRGLKSGK
jgi:heterodisulfide reductase subunit C